MSLVFSLPTLLILGFIIYEDFKFRAVTWYLFPLLAVIILIENVVVYTSAMPLQIFIINFLFIAIQLMAVTLYLSIKNKKWIWIWEQYLGLGDILFLLVLCLFFSPLNLIVFYIGSLVLTVVAVLLLRGAYPSFAIIPLAGLQSAFLAALIIFNLLISPTNYKVDPDITFLF
ncbi:hypothetical protein ACFQ21_18425 [Ohtaekwangia kribbensis]|uniref:Prepilin type IV endopeptidase peptidase domain-containing protein n=1 Tax=Ohtaekwangia kribbensis TaxID=688913 RepID=A0ABW3K4X4_9BACT